jgi:hypothetical protein
MRKLFSNNKKILFLFSFVFTCLVVAGGIFAERVDAASLNFGAGSQYSVGQTFSVNVLVSAASGEAANAVSAVASFPTDKLKLLYLSKAGTVMSLWTQEPSFSNAAGTANFEGVILNPGFSGQGGKVITLTFQAKALGDATLSFANASILANDGLGTNILTNARGITFQIVESAPEPKSNPTPRPRPTPVVEPTVVTPTVVPPLPGIITVVDTSSAQGYFTVIVILFLLLFIFFCLGLYLYHIIREVRSQLASVSERSQQYTTRAFKELHSDIDEHLRLLRQARNKRDLTEEEEIFMVTFEKRMEAAEKGILKELGSLRKKR